MSLASYEYLPEAREEDERVIANDPFLHGRRPTKLVVKDVTRRRGIDEASCCWVPGNVPISRDIPEAQADSVSSFFPKLPKGVTVEQALTTLLAKSPKYAVMVYEKAICEKRREILGMLPGIVGQLVADDRYSRRLFEETRHDSFNCLRILKGHACEERQRQRSGSSRERGVALGMMAALGVDIA